MKIQAHRRVWSATEPQGLIEICTTFGGEEININRLGRVPKPREELLDAGPGKAQVTVPRVGHDVGQVTSDSGRIGRGRCVPGHLTECRRNELAVACLSDEGSNIRGSQVVGEPLPRLSEPDRVRVAHRDLHGLEHHSTQTGESRSICAHGAANRDLHPPDSSTALFDERRHL